MCVLALGAWPHACAPEPRPLSSEELESIKDELRGELMAELRAGLERPEAPRDAPPRRPPPPTVVSGEVAAGGDAPDRAAPATPPPRSRLTPDPVPGESPDRPDRADQAAPEGAARPELHVAPPSHVEPAPTRHVEPAPPGSVERAPTADPPTPTGGPVDAAPSGRALRPGVYVYPGTEALTLSDLAVATSITDRLPQDVRQRYDTIPELLFCYNQFDNSGAETTVTHVWRRGTRLVSRVELQVGKSPKWRTWSRQRTRQDWKGPWSCEVLGPEGERIGLVEFDLAG